jgi:hypothetical protein
MKNKLILLTIIIFSLNMVNAQNYNLDIKIVPHFYQDNQEVTIYSINQIYDSISFDIILNNQSLKNLIIKNSPNYFDNSLKQKFISIYNGEIITSDKISTVSFGNSSIIYFNTIVSGINDTDSFYGNYTFILNRLSNNQIQLVDHSNIMNNVQDNLLMYMIIFLIGLSLSIYYFKNRR